MQNIIDKSPEIGSLFYNTIVNSGKKQTFLALRLGISVGHLGNILHGRENMTEKIRKDLNELLGTNY